MTEIAANAGAWEGDIARCNLVISADPALRLAALEAGANSFLSKPFVLTDVLERVQLLLAKAGPQKIEEPKPRGSDEHR